MNFGKKLNGTTKKGNFLTRFLALALAFPFIITSNAPAVMAAESAPAATSVTTENTKVTPPEVDLPASVAMARSIYGYAADYTDYQSGSFTVNAPGSGTSTGHATLKTSDFGSSTQEIYVSIYRPDGTLAKGDVKLTGNQEKVVSFSNAQAGTYTVAYSVNGVYKGWVHCWIY